MAGGNKAYKKGKRFEYKVRDELQNLGYFVTLRPKSQFPDIIAIAPLINDVFFIECKCNGKITKQEFLKFLEYDKYGEALIAYPKRSSIDKRKVSIEFKDLQNKVYLMEKFINTNSEGVRQIR